MRAISPNSGTAPLADRYARAGGAENPTLRKRPIYKAPAYLSPYTSPTPPLKRSNGLPIGTQAQFIAAARLAAQRKTPLNSLLSGRWESLHAFDDANPLFAMPAPERIAYVVELMRKWITARSKGGFQYIWVRETVRDLGEHWHIGLHLRADLRKGFAAYLGELLGEPARIKMRPASERTEGEFACSIWGSWHLAADSKPERQGFYIAAYLGKGEPSQRMFRGNLINNTRKPVRGLEFGGRERSGRYDAPQGEVIGTDAMTRRYDMARNLKRATKARRET